jgi:hypothetical protein
MPVNGRAVPPAGLTFEQEVTYGSPVTPLSPSRLVVTVEFSRAGGRREELVTPGNRIIEEYCGGRGQPLCVDAFPAIRRGGSLNQAEHTLWVGQRAEFRNSDDVTHSIRADRPGEGGCGALDLVGDLAPGESRRTDIFTEAGTCGFHDARDPGNRALRGRIVVRCCVF